MIGWCHESTATATSISISSGSDSQNTRRRHSHSRTRTRTRRTIIIAGLIPATISASERVDDKDECDETSDCCSYSLSRIEESLKILKETIYEYPCICSGPGPGCSPSRFRIDDKRIIKESTYNLYDDIRCESYDIVQGLKVIARWNWTNNDNDDDDDNVKAYDDDDDDSNDNDKEKIDAQRNTIESLPRIEFTQIGRQPKIRLDTSKCHFHSFWFPNNDIICS